MTRPTLLNYVTCSFGIPGTWQAGYHTGIDYRAPEGTKIYSTRRGQVVHARYGGYGQAYGNHVVIESEHEGRQIQHLYAHLSKVDVHVGQKVTIAQVIGRAGHTGNANGDHLHYEEREEPFGYNDHRRPVLNSWRPKNKEFLKDVLEILGIRK